MTERERLLLMASVLGAQCLPKRETEGKMSFEEKQKRWAKYVIQAAKALTDVYDEEVAFRTRAGQKCRDF